jgi:lipopolysaccharide biosynthesis glycosyltransferase
MAKTIFNPDNIHKQFLNSIEATNPGKMNYISVAITIDEKYTPYAATTLVSLFQNNPDESFKIYIIYNKISNSSKRDLVLSCNKFQHEFIFVKIDDSFLSEAPVTHHISIATYYRLSLDSLLPEDVEKVLFLDADLLIRGSVRRLWDTDLTDKALAATIAAGMDSYAEELSLKPGALYFNAGVMVVNLKYWRRINLYDKAIEVLKNDLSRIKWWDQDILNIIFEDQWLPLTLKWNAQPYIFGLTKNDSDADKALYERYDYLIATADPIIVHYAGSDKPWLNGTDLPFQDEYHFYFNNTRWKTNWTSKLVSLLKNVRRRFDAK